MIVVSYNYHKVFIMKDKVFAVFRIMALDLVIGNPSTRYYLVKQTGYSPYMIEKTLTAMVETGLVRVLEAERFHNGHMKVLYGLTPGVQADIEALGLDNAARVASLTVEHFNIYGKIEKLLAGFQLGNYAAPEYPAKSIEVEIAKFDSVTLELCQILDPGQKFLVQAHSQAGRWRRRLKRMISGDMPF